MPISFIVAGVILLFILFDSSCRGVARANSVSALFFVLISYFAGDIVIGDIQFNCCLVIGFVLGASCILKGVNLTRTILMAVISTVLFYCIVSKSHILLLSNNGGVLGLLILLFSLIFYPCYLDAVGYCFLTSIMVAVCSVIVEVDNYNFGTLMLRFVEEVTISSVMIAFAISWINNIWRGYAKVNNNSFVGFDYISVKCG
ncbi:MAG: hypothetical protein E7356_03680 [Clostridiales bacterium]|nr:hypothetical protein [Clostridiales bacterium]